MCVFVYECFYVYELVIVGLANGRKIKRDINDYDDAWWWWWWVITLLRTLLPINSKRTLRSAVNAANHTKQSYSHDYSNFLISQWNTKWYLYSFCVDQLFLVFEKFKTYLQHLFSTNIDFCLNDSFIQERIKTKRKK